MVTTCLPTLFELDKSWQFESGVTCKQTDAGIKQTDAELLIIDLVNLILQKYTVKISHQNTHNFDVHFCIEKKSESSALIH